MTARVESLAKQQEDSSYAFLTENERGRARGGGQAGHGQAEAAAQGGAVP